MKNVVFLLMMIGFANSSFAGLCRYTMIGDFAASLSAGMAQRGDGGYLSKRVEQFPSGCNKKLCTGMVECEEGGKLVYSQAACRADNYGNCPAAADCLSDYGSDKGMMVAAQYQDAGAKRSKVYPEPDEPKALGASCGKNNNDQGMADCKSFCKSRCEKLHAGNPRNIAECVLAVNCLDGSSAPSGLGGGAR